MSSVRRGHFVRQFQTLFSAGSLVGLSDGELLERSANRSGPSAEVAFAALVERHGPMVLRVCKKALNDPHDAHDAFQSTFLILARKAEAIRDKDSVASWLHGVALRVSAASRAAAVRRRKHERIKGMNASKTFVPDEPDDLGAVLHEEVGRLPGRYRSAVVLCYLEGKSYEEAARHLCLPVGTIKSRLSWARDRLKTRLVRRGLAPAAGAVSTILAGEVASAAVPLPSLWVETTTEAAMRFAAGGFAAVGSGTVPSASAALAKGVLHAMILNKIKLAVMAGAVMMTATSVGVVAQQPAAAPAGDRLDKLESKLDRLIKVLEKSAAKPSQSYGFTQPAPKPESTLAKPATVTVNGVALDRLSSQPATVQITRSGQGTISAKTVTGHAFAATSSVEKRIADLEARLQMLESSTLGEMKVRLEALEKNAAAVPVEQILTAPAPETTVLPPR